MSSYLWSSNISFHHLGTGTKAEDSSTTKIAQLNKSFVDYNPAISLVQIFSLRLPVTVRRFWTLPKLCRPSEKWGWTVSTVKSACSSVTPEDLSEESCKEWEDHSRVGTASVLWSTDAFLSKKRLKVKSTRRANGHVQQCTRSAMHATSNAHDDKSARRVMHTTIRKRTQRATHALSKAHDAQRTRRAMHPMRNGHDELCTQRKMHVMINPHDWP